MRLGCCGSLDSAADLKAAGFDFLEANVQGVLQGDVADDAWSAAAPDPEKLALPIEAANCLLPGHHAVVGPQRDPAVLREYMRRVAWRARRLGIGRLVFGSGGARQRPEGVTPEEARAHLAEFVRIAGEECARQEVVLTIEHLNRNETNTINTLAEALLLCDQAAHPAVGALVDAYHYGVEGEKEQAILDLGGRIRHVHVVEPVGRVQPGAHGAHGSHPDAFDFVHFFRLLRRVGYDEGLSIEARWEQPIAEVGARTAAYLREAWARSA